MNKALYAKMKRYIPFSALLLIIVTVSWLWANLPEEHVIRVYSESATWDLRDFNFESAKPGILGRVEFIPIPFLAPDEFADRTDEISLRYPTIRGDGGTVRLRFCFPVMGIMYSHAPALDIRTEFLLMANGFVTWATRREMIEKPALHHASLLRCGL